MEFLFTQRQPQFHYIISLNTPTYRANIVYNTAVNITNLLQVEAIISKSGFQSFEQVILINPLSINMPF